MIRKEKYDYRFNPISDWQKEQKPFLLMEPKKHKTPPPPSNARKVKMKDIRGHFTNLGITICDYCGEIYSANEPHCPNCKM